MSLTAWCPRCREALEPVADGAECPVHGALPAAVATRRGVVRRVRRAPAARRRLPDVPAVADEPGLVGHRLRGGDRRARTGRGPPSPAARAPASSTGRSTCSSSPRRPGVGLGARVRRRWSATTRATRSATDRRTVRVRIASQQVPLWSVSTSRLRRRVRPVGVRRRGRGPLAVDRAPPGLGDAAAPRRLDPPRRLRASARRCSRCRSVASGPAGDRRVARSQLGCVGAHRPPHPLAGQRRDAEPGRAGAGRGGGRARRARDHRPRHRRGLGRGGRGRRGRRDHAGARDGDQHPAPRAAACTCWPTCPTRRTRRWPTSWPGSSTAATPGSRPCSSGCAGSASTIDDRRRTPGGAATPPRPVDRTSPTRWSRSASSRDRDEAFARYLSAGRPGVRRPLRRVAGRHDRHRDRRPAGCSVVAHPWGRHERDLAGRGGARRARRTRAWPASRSTTRTTTPRAAARAARDRPRPRAGRDRLQRPPRRRQGRPRPGLQHHRPRRVRPAARPRRRRRGALGPAVRPEVVAP